MVSVTLYSTGSVPIVAGISSNLLYKEALVPILGSIAFALRYWLMHWSYNLGTDAIGIFTAKCQRILLVLFFNP